MRPVQRYGRASYARICKRRQIGEKASAWIDADYLESNSVRAYARCDAFPANSHITLTFER
jgi:hypothetical protein